MRAITIVLIGLAAIVTILSMIGLSLDLEIARMFFDPASGRFSPTVAQKILMLREHGYVSIITCGGIVMLALIGKVLSLRWLNVSGRAVILLVGTLVLSPGLLVNGVLKDYWPRSRPIDVVQFGGSEPYVEWWDPRGTCENNCSLVSGEVASAAWMFAPAILLPPPWRGAAIAGSAIFVTVIGSSRMALGAHFLTDVIFAVLTTLLVLWLMYGLVYRWPWPRFIDRLVGTLPRGMRPTTHAGPDSGRNLRSS